MGIAKGKLLTFIRTIEKKTVFIAIVIAFAIAYYINPLANVDLTEWNRTFCSAVLSGISIDVRIGNFYKLLFLYLPLLVVALICMLTVLFMHRERYAETYTKLSIFLFLATFASYISRYTADPEAVSYTHLTLPTKA